MKQNKNLLFYIKANHNCKNANKISSNEFGELEPVICFKLQYP